MVGEGCGPPVQIASATRWEVCHNTSARRRCVATALAANCAACRRQKSMPDSLRKCSNPEAVHRTNHSCCRRVQVSLHDDTGWDAAGATSTSARRTWTAFTACAQCTSAACCDACATTGAHRELHRTHTHPPHLCMELQCSCTGAMARQFLRQQSHCFHVFQRVKSGHWGRG